MSGPLILSSFPGIDLLGRAFEEEWPEACIVRGPDPLWGGDIKKFHPPAGRFDGVIGGPPCQGFSHFRFIHKTERPNLISEFERSVSESEPGWFLMENVPAAPEPAVAGYIVKSIVFNNRHVGGVGNRSRRFSFGTADGLALNVEWAPLEAYEWLPAALASGGVKPGTEHARRRRTGREYGYTGKRALETALRSQGLPLDFLDGAPFTNAGKHLVVGNGVPLPMGRAVARAVRSALESRRP